MPWCCCVTHCTVFAVIKAAASVSEQVTASAAERDAASAVELAAVFAVER